MQIITLGQPPEERRTSEPNPEIIERLAEFDFRLRYQQQKSDFLRQLNVAQIDPLASIPDFSTLKKFEQALKAEKEKKLEEQNDNEQKKQSAIEKPLELKEQKEKQQKKELAIEKPPELEEQKEMLGVVNSDRIYVRSFYEDLFEIICKTERSIVMGNPGLGKSTFFSYLLWRLVSQNPELSFPVEACPKPEVIVYQVGTALFLYDLQELKVFLMTTTSRFNLHPASLLNKNETWLVFDPSDSDTKVPYTNQKCKIIALVSPKESRIHEFRKHRGAIFYFPVWQKSELCTVGGDILKNHDWSTTDQDLKEHYEIDKIESRFERFGGILRHVFPETFLDISGNEAAQDSALEDLDKERLMKMVSLNDESKRQVTSWCAQLDVYVGPEAKFTKFRIKLLDFVSPKLNVILNDLQFEEMVQLVHYHDTGVRLLTDDLIGRLYEEINSVALRDDQMEWRKFCQGELIEGEPLGVKDFRRYQNHKSITKKKVEESEGCLIKAPSNYPLWDLVLKSGETTFFFQATLARLHQKNVTVYQNFFENWFSLDPETQKLSDQNFDKIQCIFIVPSLLVEQYSKQTGKTAVENFENLEPDSWLTRLMEKAQVWEAKHFKFYSAAHERLND